MSYRNTRIIPIALTLIVIAIAIAALVSLARAVFFSGSGTTTPNVSQADITKEALLSSGADHALVATARGPIVADESFRSYQIKITSVSREIITYKGYLETPIDKVSLGNNAKAYEQFVFALYKANLVKGTQLTGDKDDLRGICATGRVYEFKVISSEKVEDHLWTSTCTGSKGSLDASVDQLINLFTTQIPEAKALISKTMK